MLGDFKHFTINDRLFMWFSGYMLSSIPDELLKTEEDLLDHMIKLLDHMINN